MPPGAARGPPCAVLREGADLAGLFWEWSPSDTGRVDDCGAESLSRLAKTFSQLAGWTAWAWGRGGGVGGAGRCERGDRPQGGAGEVVDGDAVGGVARAAPTKGGEPESGA